MAMLNPSATLSASGTVSKGAFPLSEGASVRPAAGPFIMLCVYLATQAYGIPILQIGPSWAVWPALNDFAFGGLFLMGVASASRGFKPMPSLVSMRQALAWVALIAAVSYVLINLGLNRSRNVEGGEFGLFYIYRYIQAISLFWIVTNIPVTAERMKWIVRIVSIVLVVQCLVIIATKFFGLSGPTLAPHLPSGQHAGPWRVYAINQIKGYSTIGYNHALDSAQIVLFTALRVSLAGRKQQLINFAFILLGIAATFASGSRAGFACMGLYAFLMLVRTPGFALVVSMIIGMALLLAPASYFESAELNKALTKQSKIVDPFSSEQFIARTTIWSHYYEAFKERPHLLLIGAGVGGSEDVTGAAHSMPLMIAAEFGIIGFLAALYGAYSVTRMFYAADPKPRALFWGHVVTLISCAVQETLYPVPAMGHFLGLYLTAVALCVNRSHPFAIAQGSMPDSDHDIQDLSTPSRGAPEATTVTAPWPRVRAHKLEPGRRDNAREGVASHE